MTSIRTWCLAAWLAALAGPARGAPWPDPVRRGAAPGARPDPGAVLSFAVVLPLRHAAELDRTLAHLTDPRDPAFRHWLSAGQFAARFAPSQAEYDAVRAVVAAGSVVERPSPGRMVIDAHGSIAEVERLLHVRFGLYRHPTEARLFLSPDRAPSLDVAVPVLGVDGLTDFDLPRPRLAQAAERTGAGGSGPHGQFTGQDARAAYYGHGGLTGAGQSVGLFELGPYNPADVALYFSRVHAVLSVPVVPVSVNGLDVVCTAQNCHDAEEALDIEEAASMAPGLDRIVYYGGRVPISVLARMAGEDSCAALSVSWGWRPDAEMDEPVLKQMAAQGQTVLVATGDYGFRLKLGAVWPADDAWSIAVGGTDLATDGPGGAWRAETGWRYSGGGPSPDGIAIPAWQAPFVNAGNGGSATLRNVPDIAADADTDNFSCYNGHCSGGNGGTSYAAPLWAGFVALANEQAAREGRPAVGFFTPALYGRLTREASIDAALHDEQRGWNGRYRAGPGFDLVTGLGSLEGERTIGVLVGP